MPPLDEAELNAAAAGKSQKSRARLDEELDPVAHMRALEREVETVRERLRLFTRDNRAAHGLYRMENLQRRRDAARLAKARDRWVLFIRETIQERMDRDREQWTLHARANARSDLQAWYHHTFADELYRLRGPFWWREAVLPDYTRHAMNEEPAPTTDAERHAIWLKHYIGTKNLQHKVFNKPFKVWHVCLKNVVIRLRVCVRV